MKTKVLTVLATAMAVVGIGVLPSLAPAEIPGPGAQPQVASECPASFICFWSGKSFGRGECQAGLNCFSAFHGFELGHHDLANIDPQSVYNHTGERNAFFAQGPFGNGFVVGPGEMLQFGGRWPNGFDIANR